MKLFGRNISVSSGPLKAIKLLATCAKIFQYSKSPTKVIAAYLKRQSPEFVETRSGYRIYLSSNRNDIVTYVVVFCNQDYGKMEGKKVVLDIGANIGIFSMFAVSMGVDIVYSFEPNKESFATIQKTISFNKLESRILAFNNAVSDVSNEFLYIPKKSSPTNVSVSNLNETDQEKYDSIPTISINDFFSQEKIQRIDLMKMDCEGAEYSLLPSLSPENVSKIRSIKLEYHHGEKPILEWLEKQGYTIDFQKPIVDQVGFIWATLSQQ